MAEWDGEEEEDGEEDDHKEHSKDHEHPPPTGERTKSLGCSIFKFSFDDALFIVCSLNQLLFQPNSNKNLPENGMCYITNEV